MTAPTKTEQNHKTLTAKQLIPRKSADVQDYSRIVVWLPLALASVFEVVWIFAPPGTAMGFFSLLASVFLAGLSMIVGIALLTKGGHLREALGVLFGTVFLLPFLIWILLDILRLPYHLH